MLAITYLLDHASLGNLNTQNNISKSYQMFKSITLIFHWISAACSICFLLVFNDFISIWAGKTYILEIKTVLSIVFTFYITCISNQNWIVSKLWGCLTKLSF